MRRVVTVVVVLLLTSVAAQAASTPGMADFLAGKIAPFTLQLKDLNSTYLCFTSPYTFSSGWLSARGYNSENAPAYTQGKTVTIGGENYLIAYTVEAKGGDLTL